jgi:DNA invertase Pin-like site-specific DNA recombinase
MNHKYIAYYRVSTREQGNSGLGLEGQEASVKQYCGNNNIILIKAYTEIETGKGDNLKRRPILQKALGHCRRIGATLLIAKLDRLARSVYVTSLLHKSGIDFVACDVPSANRFIIQILSAVAEQEAKMISDRTKKALLALKERGVKLGSHRPECMNNLSNSARASGGSHSASIRKKDKLEAYGSVIHEMINMKDNGTTYKQIAGIFNDRGETTRMGCSFTGESINRLIKLGRTFHPSYEFGV